MKVFVWKSHGDVSVYAISDGLKDEILEVLEQEGFEIDRDKTYSWVEIMDRIYDAYESDSDMFEYGSGIVTVKEK